MSVMATTNITTRLLVISDAHNFELDDSNDSCHFRYPVPRADVILHCGDLTQVSGLSAQEGSEDAWQHRCRIKSPDWR